MFERQTVIVLGAGASAPFGFPLGDSLRQSIIAGFGSLKREIEEETFSGLRPLGIRNVAEFLEDPPRALASYLASSSNDRAVLTEFPHSKILIPLFEFCGALEDQTADTIDQFITENPDFLEVGKILLSQQILVNMYRREGSILRRKSFAERDIEKHRNWYHLLANILRKGARDHQALKENMIHVITFNYDLSLEFALEKLLSNTARHKGANYQEVVPIFHVNGAPSPSALPESVTDVGEFIIKAAKTFHIVDEEVGSIVEEDRAKARSAIANAQRIYVMGFQFDPSNISAIGLDQVAHKDRIFCLNFNDHRGLKTTLATMGIPSDNTWSNPNEQAYHIDQAIQDGFLVQ